MSYQDNNLRLSEHSNLYCGGRTSAALPFSARFFRGHRPQLQQIRNDPALRLSSVPTSLLWGRTSAAFPFDVTQTRPVTTANSSARVTRPS
jgi:hypothetical protein